MTGVMSGCVVPDRNGIIADEKAQEMRCKDSRCAARSLTRRKGEMLDTSPGDWKPKK